MPESLLDRPTVYGRRAKLGVIVPPTNTCNEAEWQQLLPADVTMHATRMPLHTDTSGKAGRAALYADLDHHSDQLAQADVDVIVYACTAGSLVMPVTAISDHLTARTGIASVTTAEAIVQSLRALGAVALSIATPYFEALNRHEERFFEAAGFDVVAIEGLGYGAAGVRDFRNIARVEAAAVAELVRSVDRADSDAVLISCTDLATLSLIAPLEQMLGKPVISSNSATLWASLRLAGVSDSIATGGRLLRDH